MTPSFKKKLLLTERVPDAVVNALELAIQAAQDASPEAKVYANAMERAYNEYGLDGLKTQITYMLINCAKWKGDVARESKATLKKWAK